MPPWRSIFIRLYAFIPLSFSLFVFFGIVSPRNDNNELRTPDENRNGFTFEGAIENFQARTDEVGPVNITNLFARQGEEVIRPEPLTLNLTTRSEGDPDSPSSIEYTIEGDELEALGITEFTLILDDASTADGFQIDEDDEDGIDVTSALTDIEFIIDNNLLGQSTTNSEGEGLVDRIRRVDSVLLEIDFQNNIPRFGGAVDQERFVIEAEDLNLHTYLVEPIDIARGGEVISLLNASDDTGFATLEVDEFGIDPTWFR